jgi:hypothetical protein
MVDVGLARSEISDLGYYLSDNGYSYLPVIYQYDTAAVDVLLSLSRERERNLE